MIRELARIARPAWPWLAGSLLFRTLNLFAGVALVVVPAFAILRAVEGDAPSPLAVAGLLAALATAKGLFRYLEHFLGHHAAFDLIADMRLRFFDAVATLSLDDETSGSADLTTIATRDIDRVEVFFAHTIVPALAAIIVPLGVVGAIAAGTGWVQAGIALAAFLIGAVLVPVIGRKAAASAAGETVRSRAAIARRLGEDQEGRLEVRSLGIENTRLAGLEREGERVTRSLRRTGRVQAPRAAIDAVWPVAAAIAILALADADSIVSHVGAALAVFAAAPAASATAAFARSLPAALASARRYLDVLRRVPSVADPVAPVPLPDGPLGVRIAGVAHAFGGEDVLSGISVDVPAQGRLAIVGESGSGKSTLASLLLRGRDPQRGAILLVAGDEEIDVRDLALADLRHAVAVVEQRPVFLSGTVLDNLRLGTPGLSEADAWRALDDASLGDDVRAHPDGLSARLSEDALSLSGGQRQRLSLARALARNPRVLVLDEATSHQDPATQAAVRDAIAARTDLTVIVIAHRDDAIAGIDAVLRMSRPLSGPGHVDPALGGS